jgi:plastocyanin
MSQGLRSVAVLSVLLAPVITTGARPAVAQRVGPDPAGSIRGRVEIQRALATSERRPSVSNLGMPPRRDRPDRMESVIYLENAPAGAFEPRPAGRARMTQRNETFLPYVLAVRGGSSVDFPNEDQTYHNVFSLSKVRRFDLGRYAAGKTKQVRFDQPGIVRVFCDIHSHMSAFILVFNHQFFDTTNAEGRYNIPAVPAGKYTVNAWNDGEVRDSRSVIVPEHGGTLEVDFVLR